MELIERKTYLDELSGMLRQAAGGRGHCVFLGGEAGVGKTSLVTAFAERASPATRVLTGYCDSLSTPRPLGPLVDMSHQMISAVTSLLDSPASLPELYKSVLEDLSSGATTLMIIEDAHWADEGTLDLLRFLCRRIGSVPVLIVVTFRDDDTGSWHPLRRVLGELATAESVRRLSLQPLSVSGVNQLARNSAFDPVELHLRTGGNPFFVTEVLALNEAGIPASVRDAVLARVSHLSKSARSVINACAVIGSSIEPRLLEQVSPAGDLLTEVIEIGILERVGPNLAFRHELARMAILEAIDPVTTRGLHERVLSALRTSSTADLARLTHFADAAEDAQAVLEFAPLAARRAATLGAHREAASQYRRVLRYEQQLSMDQQAAFLEAQSYECYLTDQLAEAIGAMERALSIWRTLGARAQEGNALRRLSRLFWAEGKNQEAETTSAKAIEALEQLSPGPELAAAYSTRSQLRMLAWDSDSAIDWGEKAIALAEQLGETEILVHALNNVGSARFITDVEQGTQELERSLSLALQFGLDDDVARAYTCLGCNYSEMYQLARADPYLIRGIEFSAEHDLELMKLYLSAWRARSLFYQGQWDRARALADSVLAHVHQSPLSRIVSLTVLGRLQSREGNPAALETLDLALELAIPTGEMQRLAPIRIARAENAWLRGDRDGILEEVTSLYDETVRSGHRWTFGELAFWRWRADDLTVVPEGAFEPFALQIDGNWKGAAARWRALGCPYETAVAVADSGDEADLRYALSEFKQLGAGPAAMKVTERLRRMAVQAVSMPRANRTLDFQRPETRYARSDDVNIAYQVIGEGPRDLVFVMGWVSNLEYFWEGPSSQFLRRLASFSRLIMFDKRGTGLSDRDASLPAMDQRMDDVRAVMDAAGSDRASLFGISEGAAMCALFAATYPEKTDALIIYGGYAKRVWAPDYPWAPTPFERQEFYDLIERDWGGVADLERLAPSAAADPEFRQWWSSYLRRSASPGSALALGRMNTEIDIRAVLPSIRVPTLIIHRSGDLDIDVGGARYMAEHIAGARYIELPGMDHLVFAGDQNAVLDEVERFLTGSPRASELDRVLATILEVEVTGRGAVLSGSVSRDWRSRAEAQVGMLRGNIVERTQLGLVAAFDGPGRAARCAGEIVSTASSVGLAARAGLHAGECDVSGRSWRGVPLEVASRIMGLAYPGQILASNTVRDLTAGSGIEFFDVADHQTIDLPSGWTLHQVGRVETPLSMAESARPPETTTQRRPSLLSRRESEVADLIARGFTNRQIADELSIANTTAERHVSNILVKLGYNTRAQIAAWTVAHRLDDQRDGQTR